MAQHLGDSFDLDYNTEARAVRSEDRSNLERAFAVLTAPDPEDVEAGQADLEANQAAQAAVPESPMPRMRGGTGLPSGFEVAKLRAYSVLVFCASVALATTAL